MADVEFELDTAGVREFLRGPELRALVNQVAGQVYAHVRASVPNDVPVELRTYTTDRGAATVAIPDPRGMLLQARDGVLTRAAGAAGLEIRAWR